MNHQLKFKRQGDTLVCMEAPNGITPPTKKKNMFLTSMLIIGAGLFILFLLDGGTGIITAGIAEMVKWSLRFTR